MIPKKQHIVFNHVMLEFLLLNLCIFAVLFITKPDLVFASDSSLFVNDFLRPAMIFNLIWGMIVLYNGDPDFYMSYSFRKRIKHLILNTFVFIGVGSTLAMFLQADYFHPKTFIFPIFLFSFINLFFFSFLFEFSKRKEHQAFNSNILIIGAGSKWNQIMDFSKKVRNLGYGVVGFLDEDTTTNSKELSGLNVIGKVEDLDSVLDKNLIDEIFITGSSLKKEEIKQVTDIADYRGVRVNLIPETPIYAGSNFKTYSLDGLPVFEHRQTPLGNFNNFLIKRIFDFFFALAVLIFLAPLFLIIAILIYSDGKGSIFYKPFRKGEAGGTFKCYKFRTMSVCDNPINGTKSTERNDPRITKVGKYLRKYDLDELPQFFNVLKGDMSVVGPRPHRVNLKHDFRKIVNDYMVRHYVKPGITGWAQVNGWRGPTKTDIQKKERIKHDLWYIENWSFILDIKTIFLTVFGREVRKNAF